jgi:hypothetical protein
MNIGAIDPLKLLYRCLMTVIIQKNQNMEWIDTTVGGTSFWG